MYFFEFLSISLYFYQFLLFLQLFKTSINFCYFYNFLKSLFLLFIFNSSVPTRSESLNCSSRSNLTPAGDPIAAWIGGTWCAVRIWLLVCQSPFGLVQGACVCGQEVVVCGKRQTSEGLSLSLSLSSTNISDKEEIIKRTGSCLATIVHNHFCSDCFTRTRLLLKTSILD